MTEKELIEKLKIIKEKTSQKKYSENDVRLAVRKTAQKSSEEILSLKKRLAAMEESLTNLTNKCNSLEKTNFELERLLKRKEAVETIDKIMEGDTIDLDIDEIINN